MAKKSTIKTYLPWLLVGGAAIAAYMYFKPQPTDATAPPLPPLPPGTPPEDTTPAPDPVVPKLVQIGKNAKIKTGQEAYGHITKYLGAKYDKGGSDGKGKLTSGIYAGKVLEIDGESVKVENYTYPMQTKVNGIDTWIYTYWVSLTKLEGNY